MTEPKPISDWTLEQFAQGELPAEQDAALRRRLETDAALAQRLEALRASDRELLERYPARVMTAGIRTRAGSRAEPRPLRWALLAAPAALAAVFLLFLRMGPTVQMAGEIAEDGVRLKGQTPHLVVFRVADGTAERLADGARVAPGQTLQLRYLAAGKAYGAVVSIDGRGSATLHWPTESDKPPRLGTGEVSLPNAFQLDDAPGFERFFLVTSDQPVFAGQVEAAAQALAKRPDARTAPLSLPMGWEQTSLLLDKEGR